LKFILQLCFDHNSQFKLEFGYYLKVYVPKLTNGKYLEFVL